MSRLASVSICVGIALPGWCRGARLPPAERRQHIEKLHRMLPAGELPPGFDAFNYMRANLRIRSQSCVTL